MKLKIGEKNKKLLTAISIILGTIVGAGFLGLSYVAAKTGFILTTGYLIFIGGVIVLILLSYYFLPEKAIQSTIILFLI
jgi:amino acid permease